MASFRIHEDQENRGPDPRLKQHAQFGQQKRNVLGALDNKPERVLKAKQPLGISNKFNKANNENAGYKQIGGKPPAPVVPVAQFQAFKVYEDNPEEVQPPKDTGKPKTIDEIFRDAYTGTQSDRLVTKLETLNKAGFDVSAAACSQSPIIVDDTPMSIEKVPKENVDWSPVVYNRNKDLFFELDEYRPDIYEHLQKQEKLHRAKASYMRKQPDITHNMRTILVDWLVEVSEEYKLQTETLYLAVNYIDRFLSFMSVVRAKLQLVGTAAMFIAAKYEEIYSPEVSEFVYITDDTYSKRQVIRMEGLILKVLDFDVSPPTTYTFITAISINNHLPEKVTYLAQFLSELALLEAEPTLDILPSAMASSAIALARHTIGQSPWTAELTESTGYVLSDLQANIEFLSSIHQKAEGLPQQAIQEKYNKAKYLHVSTIPPRDEEIKF